MNDNAQPFSPKALHFFNALREDIAKRPDFYRPGIDLLNQRFSPDALFATAKKTWKARPENAKRPLKPKGQKNRHPLTNPKRSDARYCLSNCLIRAFRDLLREGLGREEKLLTPSGTDKPKAVLCLTWLLTDENAHKLSIGEPFGPWQIDTDKKPDTFGELKAQIAVKGRAMAWLTTLNPRHGAAQRARWMDLARQSWKILRHKPLAKPSKDAEGGAGHGGQSSEDGKPQKIDTGEPTGEFPPMEWIEPKTDNRYSFGSRKVLWQVWRALRTARQGIALEDWSAKVEAWRDSLPDSGTVKQALYELRKFWIEKGRVDLAKRIQTKGAATGPVK
jgi:hypothetical protein